MAGGGIGAGAGTGPGGAGGTGGAGASADGGLRDLFAQVRDAVSRSEPEKALSLLGKCLAKARASREPGQVGPVLFEMGFLLTSLSRYGEAADAYEEALTHFAKPDFAAELAATLSQLVQVYRLLGRTDDAVAACNRAREVCRKAGDRRGEGKAAGMLGQIAAERDGPAAALALMVEAAGLVRAASPEEAELMVLHAKFFGREKLPPDEFEKVVRSAAGTDAAFADELLS
jgi:tetratricopeptide (TPR) repeat protein